MRILLPFAPLLWVACYDPDLTSVRFACTGDGQPDDCPSGYTCVQSVCRPPGEVPDGGGSSTAAGCTNTVGYDVAKDPMGMPVFACPGSFLGTAASNATTLCTAGYSLCTSADSIDLNKCNTPAVQGFFIARVFGEHGGSSTACGDSAYSEDLWAGCGHTENIRLVPLSQPCSGFSLARDCDGNTSFNCRGDGNNDRIEAIISSNAVHGVLCCKQ
jgi:hypothetical protein